MERSPSTRLLEIETRATEARLSAREFFSLMGFAYPTQWDLDSIMIVASNLTHFIVQLVPNLDHNGDRVSGLLIEEDGLMYLRCESYDPKVRQVFSIAHELGHYFLHLNIIYPDSTDIEWEADAFAASFLIPACQLRKDLTVFGPSAAFLARKYGLSEAVIKKRVETLSHAGANEPSSEGSTDL